MNKSRGRWGLPELIDEVEKGWKDGQKAEAQLMELATTEGPFATV